VAEKIAEENLNIIRKWALGDIEGISGRKEDEFKEEKILLSCNIVKEN
jgi:hypothetical protein